MMTTVALCPCCNAPVAPGRILVDLASKSIVGPKGRAIVQARTAELVFILAGAKGAFVSRADIMKGVWGRRGVPDDDTSLAVCVTNARHGVGSRPGIRSIGLDIVSQRGCGYRLVEIETAQEGGRA